MAGPAFTVRIHTADILMVGKALSECPKDHVLVIDGHGECNTALWGGLTTQAALAKGVAGVVIDGAIRDSAEIRAQPSACVRTRNRSRCRRRGIRRRASGARAMRRRGGEPRRLAGWG